MVLELQKRCSKTPPPFALQLHGVGSSMEFWSWSVWLENWLELLEFSSRAMPNRALNGVLPVRALVGAQLRMNTAVVTTSPQNLTDMPLAFIMDRAMPTTVWFHCSTMPFCCGEYGAVWCRTTP